MFSAKDPEIPVIPSIRVRNEDLSWSANAP
jgi:hypothetical protein